MSLCVSVFMQRLTKVRRLPTAKTVLFWMWAQRIPRPTPPPSYPRVKNKHCHFLGVHLSQVEAVVDCHFSILSLPLPYPFRDVQTESYLPKLDMARKATAPAPAKPPSTQKRCWGKGSVFKWLSLALQPPRAEECQSISSGGVPWLRRGQLVCC